MGGEIVRSLNRSAPLHIVPVRSGCSPKSAASFTNAIGDLTSEPTVLSLPNERLAFASSVQLVKLATCVTFTFLVLSGQYAFLSMLIEHHR